MRARRTAAIAALTTSTLGLAAGSALAAPVTVTSCTGGDNDQLARALANVDANPVYISGTICTGNYTVSRRVTIEGIGTNPGFAAGDESGRSLRIDNRHDVTLKNLRFTGAPQSGGVAYGDVGLVVEEDDDEPEGGNVVIPANPGGSGGAGGSGGPTGPGTGVIIPPNPGDPGVGGPLIPDPKVPNRLGVTESDAGDLTVVDVEFENNSAENNSAGLRDGGGLQARTRPGGAVTVTGSTFQDNRAMDGGGAAISAATITIEDSTFDGNDAFGAGGGLLAELQERAAGGTTITDSTFTDNTLTAAEGSRRVGGGLHVRRSSSSPPLLARMDGDADADVVTSGNTVAGNRIDDGWGTHAGGGAAFTGVHVVSTEDTFADNEVGNAIQEAGGGIAIFTPDGNSETASFDGTNTVVAGNAVGGNRGVGGGIGVVEERIPARGDSDGDSQPAFVSVALTHATVTGNTASQTGPAIGTDKYTDLDVDASIVWDNTLTTREPQPVTFARAAGVREIDGEFGRRNVTRSIFCDVPTPADPKGNVCADPKLVDAAEGDIHLAADSPAIDAIPVPAARRSEGVNVDFEGDRRPMGRGRDMGADEFRTPDSQPQNPGQETTQEEQQQPPAAGGVQGQSATSVARPAACTSRRFFRITLRKHRGPFKAARIVVNGKRAKVRITRTGRATTRVDLRRFSREVIRVRIVATRTNGDTVRGQRVYNPCRPGLGQRRPPKL